MKCRRVRKRLSAYQDGELGSEKQVRIKTHLKDCPACRQWYTEFRQMWQLLGDLPDIEPRPEFYPRLQAKISSSLRQPRFFPRLREVFQILPAPAQMAAMLIIGLVIGIYLADAVRQGWSGAGRMTQSDARQSVTISTFKAFDAIPPGSLAHGYIQMAGYLEEAQR